MDWTRGQTIGQGSSATVSLATDCRSGKPFAVKSTELSKSQFLQREQQILSSLNFPHIVSYKGCDVSMENDKLMYNLFMEYVPGGSLTDTIHRHGGRLSESCIGIYTRQIVQGLEYLHAQVLVHCDIKARNILIGQDGAKIADFGCTKQVDSVTAQIGGTPVFMSPEAARGEEQGFPSDIWAVGCVVIEMATGGSPWDKVTDPVSIIYKIGYSHESPEIPSFLSEQAKDFLEKCLKRNPKHRWTASQLLQHPFLEEFNSDGKGIQESYSNSPTSILDQGIWNSVEETQFLGNLVQTSCRSFSDERIRRLSVSSGEPRWIWDEKWITVRGQNLESEDQDDMICGSALSSSSSDDLEEDQNEKSGKDKCLVFEFLEKMGSRSRICRNYVEDTRCKNGDVISDRCCNRDRHEPSHYQISSFL